MSALPEVIINQSVAILIDGNNIERGLQKLAQDRQALLDFDRMVPKLLQNRGLKRLIYFREGISISDKLAERLLNNFHGSVVPCHKSADIPLTIMATQIAQKVDTIIILSGDSDYVELVRHLKGEGVRVEIAAVQHATAKILVDEVEHFTPITLEDCYILKVPGRTSSSSRSTTTKRSTSFTKKTSETKTDSSASDHTTEKPKRAPRKTSPKSKDASPESKEVKPEAKRSSDKPKAKRATTRRPAKKDSISSEVEKDNTSKSKRAPAKRRPAAKSIKELEKEGNRPAPKRIPKPVVKKKDDWDDLSF